MKSGRRYMKKLNKGFMFYFGIFFAILIAAFLICVVILVLSPGTSIFGLKYFKTTDQETYTKMQVYEKTSTADGEVYTFKEESPIWSRTSTAYPIKKIVIASNGHHVSLVKANQSFKDSDSFLITVNNGTNGFSTEDDVTSEKSLRYYTDTGILEIYAKIPTGFWVTGNSSQISVQIPMSYEASGIDLEIDAGKGSVSIGDAKTGSNLNPNCLTFKSANIKANSLSVTEYGQIGTPSRQEDCSFNLEEGLSSATAIFANNLTIKSNDGHISIRKEDLSISALGNVSIETKNVTAEYGKVKCTALNLVNIYGSQKFAEVQGDVVVSSSSRQCDYTFDSLSNNLTVGVAKSDESAEKKAEKCNFVVKKCKDVVFDIHTTGTVSIEQAVNMNESISLVNVEEGYFEYSTVIKGARYTFSFKEETVEEVSRRTCKIVSSLGGEASVSFVDDAAFEEFNSTIDGINFKVTFISATSWNVYATR